MLRIIKMLRIIIAGSRDITDYNQLIICLQKAISINFIPYSESFEIVSGGARGVDMLARKYAIDSGYKLTEMKPEYKHNNDRYAPLKRNIDIAEYGDILLAIWDGKSTGTKHIIDYMKKINKPVFIHLV